MYKGKVRVNLDTEAIFLICFQGLGGGGRANVQVFTIVIMKRIIDSTASVVKIPDLTYSQFIPVQINAKEAKKW